MRIRARGPRGVTVAFHRNGQVFGGEILSWPDDRPPPPWADAIEGGPNGVSRQAEAPPAAEAEEEVSETLSGIGDMSDEALRAFIEERHKAADKPLPKGLHFMKRPALLKRATALAALPSGAIVDE